MSQYKKLWDAITSKQEKVSYTLYCNLLAGHVTLYSRECSKKYGLAGRTLEFQLGVWASLEIDYRELERPEKVKEYQMLQLRTQRRLAQKKRK